METAIENLPEMFEQLGYGIEIEDIVIIGAAEMAQTKVARKNWATKGDLETNEIDGHKITVWRDAQAVKGQRRRDVVIIELGSDTFAVYGYDNDSK